MSRRGARASQRKTVLVFGESHNDTKAIASLVEALRPDLDVVPYRAPTVLIHQNSAGRSNIRKNIDQIKAVAKAASTTRRVVAVLLHKDCDAVDPAHVALSHAVESQMGVNNFVSIASTPDWELEAWWYLWPAAVHTYHPSWKRLGRAGTNVGLITDVKERLIRDLRPNSKSTRDYRESDSIGIALEVRDSGSIFSTNAVSHSFAMFRTKVAAI